MLTGISLFSYLFSVFVSVSVSLSLPPPPFWPMKAWVGVTQAPWDHHYDRIEWDLKPARHCATLKACSNHFLATAYIHFRPWDSIFSLWQSQPCLYLSLQVMIRPRPWGGPEVTSVMQRLQSKPLEIYLVLYCTMNELSLKLQYPILSILPFSFQRQPPLPHAMRTTAVILALVS